MTVDDAGILERLISQFAESEVHFCVVGGQAVSAYVEPLVSLDLDLAVSAADVTKLEAVLRPPFKVERFAHSINVAAAGSDPRVQFETDPRYGSFPDRATKRRVLGIELPVASLEDVLDDKVWAASDPARRPSKRQKDLADIDRIFDRHPGLRGRVPAELLDRLV